MNGLRSSDLAPALVTAPPAPAAGSAQGRGSQQDSAGPADGGAFATVLGDVLGSAPAHTPAAGTATYGPATGTGTSGMLESAGIPAEPSSAVGVSAERLPDGHTAAVPAAADPAQFVTLPFGAVAAFPSSTDVAATSPSPGAVAAQATVPAMESAFLSSTPESPRGPVHAAGQAAQTGQQPPAAMQANSMLAAAAAAAPGLAAFVPAEPAVPDSTRAAQVLAGNTPQTAATATVPVTVTQTPAAQAAGPAQTPAAQAAGTAPVAVPLVADAGGPANAVTGPAPATGSGKPLTSAARPGNVAPAGSPAAAVNGPVPVNDAALRSAGLPADTSGENPPRAQPAAAPPASGSATATSATATGTSATATGTSATAAGVEPSRSAAPSTAAAPAVLAAGAESMAAAGGSSGLQLPAPAPTAPSASSLPAAPEPAQPAVTLQPQLMRPLFTLAGAPQGQHIMTLQVTPEDIGPLTVRAQIDAAGVRIELFAPADAGREAIRGILPELRKELADSGFGASLDVSDRAGPGGSGHDSAARDGSARDPGQDGGRGSRSGPGPGAGNAPGEQRGGHRWDELADGAAVRAQRTLNGPQTTLDILV